MERTIQAASPALCLPVIGAEELQMLEIFCEGEKRFELQIPRWNPETEEGEIAYYVPVPVGDCRGKALLLSGEFPEAFFDCILDEEAAMAFNRRRPPVRRPAIHFTPSVGWMNDPNGLVCQDGVYHLYYQYNPFSKQWCGTNLCWGHAVSTDLLHWEDHSPALYPDQTGSMYSGSGIVNERGLLDLPRDALLFFYTAAGGNNRWSEGRAFTQRVAYSLDRGETMTKTERGLLPTICVENRDPKVFWHEESRAYIMVLWLEERDFAIFRSPDLEGWEMTDRLTLGQAWECPDLLRLRDGEGQEHWVFLSADGYYFLGSFDGYHFQTDFVQHMAYATRLPYAAQTYSNTPGRTILIPWLRLPNAGRVYTGAMGIPREVTIVPGREGYRLALTPVRELRDFSRLLWDRPEEDLRYTARTPQALLLRTCCRPEADSVYWHINGTEMVYHRRQGGAFCVGEQTAQLPEGIDTFQLLIDGHILELTALDGTVAGMFELPEHPTEVFAGRRSFEEIQLFQVM